MNLWIPQASASAAIGELPDDVTVGQIPRQGELPAALIDAEFLVPRAGDARLEAMLSQMHGLRVVQTLSAGVDRLLPLVPQGVTVCDARGARDAAVAEWVMAAILASRRRLPQLRDSQRRHEWTPGQAGELLGASVLILGYGSIGAAVEARLAPFEVRVTRVARHARAGVHAVAELAGLLPDADIVVVLLPLTEETEGLLDADMLARLPHGALLVNAARGPVLDTDALLAQLRAQRLTAALDVVEPEPLPPGHPLWDAPGVLITPHEAGDTAAAERRAFALAGEQVRRYVRGEPLANVVEHGY